MSDLVTQQGTGLLLAIVASLGLSVLVAGVGLLVLDRVSLRAKLRGIDDLYRLVGVRDQELMMPLVDRVSGPFQNILSKLGQRVTPSGYAEGVRVLMRRAGRLDPAAADRFLALRSLSLLMSPVLALVSYSVMARFGSLKFISAGVAVRRASCCRRAA